MKTIMTLLSMCVFALLTVQEEQGGKAADWMEKVTDGQYTGK